MQTHVSRGCRNPVIRVGGMNVHAVELNDRIHSYAHIKNYTDGCFYKDYGVYQPIVFTNCNQ